MTSLVSRRKHGFSSGPLHSKREPHPLVFLRQQSSFWIATLSVMAFVIGNMVGHHGWYLFWASVLGNSNDSLIVYTGTVTPLEKVPDYSRWSTYGGNSEEHTFRQVPQDLLVDLPTYNQSEMIRTRSASSTAGVYSVGNRGSYATGAENSGSHPGVDIRTPIGTPVRSIANGIVDQVKSGGGFGLVVVIRHPNVPDPDRPSRNTTLYSSYAHLQSAVVQVGDIVEKAEHIAYSGDSGYASGPHLHFQMDRESAPFHPYWPFTDAEAGRAGLSLGQAVDTGLNSQRLVQFTAHPMLYVQSNYSPVETQGTTVVQQTQEPEEQQPTLTRQERIALRVQQRLAERAAERRVTEVREEVEVAIVEQTPPVLTPAVREEEEEEIEVRMSPSQRAILNREQRIQEREERARFASRQAARSVTPIVQRDDVVAVEGTAGIVAGPVQVVDVNIQHDGSYTGRGWEKVVIQLLDGEGDLITNPVLTRDIYLRTAYGDAEFRPSVLTQLDFAQGETTVYMLPRGRRTIVIQAQPYPGTSKPMGYAQE